ncbi:hypothetical protein [Nocardioides sp. GY 10127]|uniref:hypothetical protein n=1 Tax=Nocardioides sp. GY 10127 TaxID=2569762 RepID=UPI0010A78B63|nr:hypothetical protein [Nocardioides sp. GY 10127]TIC78803.1 hypothetical protein E8D37_19090 [Nocardioides sp. GY 10127]
MTTTTVLPHPPGAALAQTAPHPNAAHRGYDTTGIAHDHAWNDVLDLMAAGISQHDASQAVWGNPARIRDHRLAATLTVRAGFAAAFPNLVLPPIHLPSTGA